MIQSINVGWNEWQTAKKTWKPEWISSVELSKTGIDTTKLRNYCDRNLYYHAIQFNISGTIKYWFERKNIISMVIFSGAKWKTYKGWEKTLLGNKYYPNLKNR
jgi:hypothetical protein